MIRVKRKLNSVDVVVALTDLFILRGPPAFIRSDNGAEFIAQKVRAWIGAPLMGCLASHCRASGRREDGVHRAWLSVGERILRKLQLPFPRRTSERRGVLHVT